MSDKPTYEELEQRVKELEKEAEKRKRAEDEVKRVRDEYISITNLIQDIIIGKTDKDGNWIFLNDNACEFWGYSREEMIGTPFAEYIHPDDKEST